MAIKSPVTMPTDDRTFQKWCRDTYDLRVKYGEGSPAGVVVADIGTLYMRTDGSPALWVKESSNGTSAGWVSK